MAHWPQGTKTELARRAGLSPQFLNDILAGRKPCPAKKALRLAAESSDLVGEEIPVEDWIRNDSTKNPYFHNRKDQK